MSNDGLLQKVVSLAKRRGFIFPGSEIYGGLANTYDFGPLGNALKRNLSNYWWNNFVERREDMFGLDSSILMSPKVWEASGHTASFTNIMVDCTNCHFRTRADHLIEDALLDLGNVEGKPLEELDQIIAENKIKCPNCGKVAWTKSRLFNQLFETKVGIITNDKNNKLRLIKNLGYNKIENLLKTERDRINKTLDSMKDLVYILSKDQELEYINPAIEKVYNNMGVAYLQLNNLPEGEKMFLKSVEINPNFVEGYTNLVRANYAAGKKDEALKICNKILSIDPKNNFALNVIAQLKK